MNRLIIPLLMTAAWAGAADLQYVERTQMTGGMLVQMTGMLGRLAKGVNDPILTTHSYSGNKKASVSAKSHEIWDLDSETITSINMDDKQYSVITFAEMAQLATAMAERMSKMQPGAKPAAASDTNVTWKASFDKNGQTRQVAGITASGGTMKLEAEGTDAKTGQSGSMKMEIDFWMGKVPGWEVKQAFDKRTGEKMGAQVGPQMQALAQAGPAAMDAMKEAGRKMAELGEMQLASVTKVYSDNVPNMPNSSTQSGSGAAPPQGPSAGEIVQEEAKREAENEALRRAGGGLGGRLGGRIGGRLGGFGRKPKQEAPPAPPPQSQPAQETVATGPGLLMETTSEVISYSSRADANSFVIPAGFKQVEHPMKKAFGRSAGQ